MKDTMPNQLHPMEKTTLTNQDLEVIRSFILPIQQNIPLADNPKKVCTVLMMITCGMIENVHFGSVFPQEATFTGDGESRGFELFSEVNTTDEIQRAAISYLFYLRDRRIIDPEYIRIEVGHEGPEGFEGLYNTPYKLDQDDRKRLVAYAENDIRETRNLYPKRTNLLSRFLSLLRNIGLYKS